MTNLKPVIINKNDKTLRQRKVSIIIVTFNALPYVKICLNSLSKTNYKNKEIIVVDNNSDFEVRKYLESAKKKGIIDKLYLSPENTFFTIGNNLGVTQCSKDSDYILLLNSDIEIKDPNWLDILMAHKPEKGIISFGKVDIPAIRPDGWCFMVNKSIYHEIGKFNEFYKMDWGITEYTGRVLQAGYSVRSISNPNEYVYHFGQKSRLKRHKKIFNRMTTKEIINLYKGTKVELLYIN